MARLADNPKFAFAQIEAFITRHSGISAKAEPRLPDWYEAARDKADRMLRRDWTDADGNDVEPPIAVKLALADGVRALSEEALAGGIGVSSVGTGSLSESYAGPRTPEGALSQAMLGRLRGLMLKSHLW